MKPIAQEVTNESVLPESLAENLLKHLSQETSTAIKQESAPGNISFFLLIHFS